MSKLIKTILQLVAVLTVGFIGGVLGNQLTSKTQGTSVENSNKPSTTVPIISTNNTNSTTEAVKKVQDAVVSVLNYQSSSSGNNPYSIFENKDSAELTVVGKGSGIIYKKDGDSAYLVTNTHVVAGAEKIDIQLANGTIVEGTLVGSDTYSDVAVVKINAEKVSAIAEFGDSSILNVGETAIAIGSPLGTEYANSVTQGIISSLSRTVTSQSEDGQTISTNAIQTDAAINPGNSGGPLINIEGQVIGITSSKISSRPVSAVSSVAIEGIGFAIPSNDAVAIIEQLEASGKVSRPSLGIRMVNLTDLSTFELEKLKVPSELTAGIVIANVESGLSADGILEKYDIITKIDDKKITTSSDLQSALYSKNIGDTIKVTFYRDGKEQTEQVHLTSSTEDL